MNNLDGFLKKFKTALGVLNKEKTLIAEALSASLGVKISEESFVIKSNVVYISGGGSLKSQIFLKKKVILESFHKHEELKKISDIR